MTSVRRSSPFLTSVGLAGSALALLSATACRTSPPPAANITTQTSSLSSVAADAADIDTQHRLMTSPNTSKMYSLLTMLTASGQTVVLQDATFSQSPVLLSGMQTLRTQSGSLDYRGHTLVAVQRIQDANGEHDELWAYTTAGGKRLMQGRDILFALSPQARFVAAANAHALQLIDVRTGTLERTLASSDLPQSLVSRKENFFGKPTTLVPQAWSDDGSALWFSADIGRPYAFAKLTVGTGNIDTYALDKDFTATDTALNANTGKMAFSDAKASNNNQKVTLSILDLMTNDMKTVMTATGGALHPQWLNDDTLFIVKNGKKMPMSLQ